MVTRSRGARRQGVISSTNDRRRFSPESVVHRIPFASFAPSTRLRKGLFATYFRSLPPWLRVQPFSIRLFPGHHRFRKPLHRFFLDIEPPDFVTVIEPLHHVPWRAHPGRNDNRVLDAEI